MALITFIILGIGFLLASVTATSLLGGITLGGLGVPGNSGSGYYHNPTPPPSGYVSPYQSENITTPAAGGLSILNGVLDIVTSELFLWLVAGLLVMILIQRFFPPADKKKVSKSGDTYQQRNYKIYL